MTLPLYRAWQSDSVWVTTSRQSSGAIQHRSSRSKWSHSELIPLRQSGRSSVDHWELGSSCREIWALASALAGSAVRAETCRRRGSNESTWHVPGVKRPTVATRRDRGRWIARRGHQTARHGGAGSTIGETEVYAELCLVRSPCGGHAEAVRARRREPEIVAKGCRRSAEYQDRSIKPSRAAPEVMDRQQSLVPDVPCEPQGSGSRLVWSKRAGRIRSRRRQ
jgi:hypothetical protein